MSDEIYEISSPFCCKVKQVFESMQSAPHSKRLCGKTKLERTVARLILKMVKGVGDVAQTPISQVLFCAKFGLLWGFQNPPVRPTFLLSREDVNWGDRPRKEHHCDDQFIEKKLSFSTWLWRYSPDWRGQSTKNSSWDEGNTLRTQVGDSWGQTWAQTCAVDQSKTSQDVERYLVCTIL